MSIETARRLAVESKLTSAICERAILGGHWDNGEYVQSFLPAAEIEDLKHPVEVID